MAAIAHRVRPGILRARLRATRRQTAAFCRKYHISWLAVFGSVLREDFRPDSDIDVIYAIEPEQRIDRFAAADELAALFGHGVDFIALPDLRWRIRARVLADAETLSGETPEEYVSFRKPRTQEWEVVKDENLYLGDMLDIAREARDIVAGKTRAEYDTNRIFQLAVLHIIQTIGEAATHVSQATRAQHPKIPWGDIIGMRNILVHRYDALDHDDVWETVTNGVPALIAELETMLPPEMRDES
jgi:uncharacterized protein with HEPN domain/predicted nucleotidyltransferase